MHLHVLIHLLQYIIYKMLYNQKKDLEYLKKNLKKNKLNYLNLLMRKILIGKIVMLNKE